MGLMPLMVTRDFDTAPFVPLAVSLGFGVIFATGVTLILIPALYVILEDFSSLLGKEKETVSGNDDTPLVQ
jgi:multidrug efflux pump subunit AcrB